jgi:hypothetical protein
MDNNNKYRIPSNRLYGYDYGGIGCYYITICTKTRKEWQTYKKAQYIFHIFSIVSIDFYHLFQMNSNTQAAI